MTEERSPRADGTAQAGKNQVLNNYRSIRTEKQRHSRSRPRPRWCGDQAPIGPSLSRKWYPMTALKLWFASKTRGETEPDRG